MAKSGDDRMTVPRFVAAKSAGAKLAVLTAYDYSTARIFDEAGIDAILVGDTLGVVVQGRPNTLAVTMDQMVYHTEMVSRACRRALVVADLPFLSYQASVDEAIRNAGRLIKEGGAHAVKLEGGVRSAATIAAIIAAQIPVMGHIGLTPQSIHRLGGYRAQRDHDAIVADAKAVASAGAFSIVLETIPSDLGKDVTAAVDIPTIGIGAGVHCDGQVLVWHDAFGVTVDFKAKYVKHYANLLATITGATRQFIEEVRAGSFPDDAHSYR